MYLKNESSPISSSAASLVESVLTGGPGFLPRCVGVEFCVAFTRARLSVFRAVAGREVEKRTVSTLLAVTEGLK